VNYCVDCRFLSMRVKGKNTQGFDGFCLKIKKECVSNKPCVRGFHLNCIMNLGSEKNIKTIKLSQAALHLPSLHLAC